MKRRTLIGIAVLFAMMFQLQAQEMEPATEAGEDFDLYAALSLFQNAEDLEDYEKLLNDEANDVNNLDLNADDEVDIVRIVEVSEDNTKVLVIQAVIGENDYQELPPLSWRSLQKMKYRGRLSEMKKSMARIISSNPQRRPPV